MSDFCNDMISEDPEVRERFWERFRMLTPQEKNEYDLLALQASVGKDNAARFAELEKIAEDRLGR